MGYTLHSVFAQNLDRTKQPETKSPLLNLQFRTVQSMGAGQRDEFRE